MSLQWTAVATFLYAGGLRRAPAVSPYLRASGAPPGASGALDAVREIQKYDDVTEKVNLQNNPGAVEHFHMKLFRAQRNLYLAGFSLLLLRRLVTLISQQASLLASNAAFRKQAEGASDAAKRYMEDNDQLKQALKQAGVDVGERPAEGPGATEQNEALQAELKHEALAMRKQAQGLTQEYDRLLEEHGKLQVRQRGVGGCVGRVGVAGACGLGQGLGA
uniref:Endoplasmic reticulum transmembrane protein n=1 Tax=Chelonoidis abingdonii TaxID=106734 RepID=A0A8C0JH29_CHEAB